MFLQNVGDDLSDLEASDPVRLQSSAKHGERTVYPQTRVRTSGIRQR
jgi:hypothetical protein